MRFTTGLIFTFAALAGSVLHVRDGAAQSGRAYYDGQRDYVVAESWWGHGSIRAPVRQGRAGLEVRLPRGTWIGCGRSCAQTLRQQTVDYWESNGPQAKDSGPGYFRWSFGW
jgi:hypothetical protein